MGETAPFWRFSAASYPDLERPMSNRAFIGSTNQLSDNDARTSSGVLTLTMMSNNHSVSDIYLVEVVF